MDKKSNNYIWIVIGLLVAYLIFSGRADPYLNKVGLGLPTPTSPNAAGPIGTPAPTFAPGKERNDHLQETQAAAALATQQQLDNQQRASGTKVPTWTALPPTPGPATATWTPVPVVINLDGDPNAARQILEASSTIANSDVVEVAIWDGSVYGESLQTLSFKNVTIGPVKYVGEKMLSKAPDSSLRIGVQGQGRVVAGVHFKDLLPADLKIGKRVEVPCNQEEVQTNAQCFRQDLEVTLRANICFTMPQISRNLQIFYVDKPSLASAIAAGLLGDSFSTMDGANLAWADFYDRLMSTDHLMAAGSAAELNLKQGSLYDSLKVIYSVGGWREVRLKVQTNNWQLKPIYCDGSPIAP